VAASNTIITPTYTGSPTDKLIAAGTYGNVDQTTPIVENHSDGGEPGDNPFTTIDIAGTTGNAVVAAVGSGIDATTSWETVQGLSEQRDFVVGTSSLSTADALVTATGTVTVEGTLSVQNRAVGMSLELQRASSGTIVTITDSITKSVTKVLSDSVTITNPRVVPLFLAVIDTFTEAQERKLFNHSPEFGQGWHEPTGKIRIELAVDQLNSGNPSADRNAVQQKSMQSNDMAVTADVRVTSNSLTDFAGVRARVPSNINLDTGYIARYSGDGSGVR